MRNRKGVSPIIATVLLLAIALSLGIVFTNFVPNLMSGLTSDTSEETEQLSAATSYSLNIESATVDRARDSVEVMIENTGEEVEGNVTVTVFCDTDTFQEKLNSLSEGELKTATVDGVSCDVDNIRASMNEYPVSDEEDKVAVEGTDSISYSSYSNFEEAAKTVTDVVYAPLKLAKNTLQESESSTYSGTKTNTTADSGVLQLAKE